MSFCRQCGAELNGAKFCSSCGTYVDEAIAAAPATAVVHTAGDSRQQSLMEMRRLLDYFGAKEDQYKEYDTVSAQIQELHESSSGGFIILGIITFVIALISEAFFWYILTALSVAAYFFFKKRNKDRLAVATARQASLEEELNTYYKNYGYCPVGQKYVKPETLRAINDVIEDGRANSTSEAINILKSDADMAESLRLAQEAADAAKDAAKQAKANKRWAAASFIFRR